MKKQIFVMLGCLITLMSYAEGNTDPIPNSDFTIIKKKKPNPDPNPNPVRPRVPGIDRFLTVSFSNGVMTVEMPGDAESGVVTIGTGAFEVFTAAIDRSCNTVELPPLSGEFLLTVTFDNDDVYEGEVAF